MAVAPADFDGIVAYGFHIEHLEPWLVHLKRRGRRGFLLGVIGLLGLGAMCARAGGARAFVAQQAKRQVAVMAIAPIDQDAFGFGNGDVFGISLHVNSSIPEREAQCVVRNKSLGAAFHVAHASDAANTGDHTVQLLLITDFNSHLNNG